MNLEWGYSLLRSYPLEDIEIQRGGDGRTVEAYAAVFDTPQEIKDAHGHYNEVIARGAFDRTVARWSSGTERPVLLYNHGMTMHGTPSDMWSVPIGSPVDIRVEPRGLLTVSRYNNTPEADRVLEAIRNGDITAYSFRGNVYQSNPMRVPRRVPGAALPVITRTELSVKDYGPTPTAYYADALITAVRSTTQLVTELEQLDDDERQELLRRFTATPEEDPAAENATPDEGLGTEDSPLTALLSAEDIRRRARAAMILRSMQ